MTDEQVFELILAGTPQDEIQTKLDGLSSADRQAVLCTACYLLDEIAANCRERADEIEAVIAKNCPKCRAGERFCFKFPARRII